MPADWGSVPDWVQTVGNLVILVTAFEAIRRERQRTRVLEREQLEQSRQRDLELVSGVSAWPEDWSSRDVRLVCRNGCAEPIYDVTIQVSEVSTGAPPDRSDPQGTKSIFMMRPGEEVETSIDLLHTVPDQPLVEMVFRDTRGNRWWRQVDGRLLPLPRSAITARVNEDDG